MKRLFSCILLLLSLALAAAEKTTIEMSVREGKLRYSIEAFTVSPGAQVEIKFKNNDHEMLHNMVICKNNAGVLGEVGMAAVMLADKAEEMKYVPKHPGILFASDLVEAGETITFSFTAPTEEGPYPYLCTLPGHYMLMRGVMTVSNKKPVIDSPLYNLSYKRYGTLPPKASLDSFDTFMDPSVGELEKGQLSLMAGNPDGKPDTTKPFAIEFDAQLLIPVTGAYRFTLDMIGMVDARLGDTVLFRNGNGRKTLVQHSDMLQLKRGVYPLTVKYLAYHGPYFENDPCAAISNSASSSPMAATN